MMNKYLLLLTLVFSISCVPDKKRSNRGNTSPSNANTQNETKPQPQDSAKVESELLAREAALKDAQERYARERELREKNNGGDSSHALMQNSRITKAGRPDAFEQVSVTERPVQLTQVGTINTPPAAAPAPAAQADSRAKSADRQNEVAGGGIGTITDRYDNTRDSEAKSPAGGQQASDRSSSGISSTPKGNEQDQSEAEQLQRVQQQAAEQVQSNLDNAVIDAEKNKSPVFKTEDEVKIWQTLIDYIIENGIPMESTTGAFITVTDYSNKDDKVSRVINQFSVVASANQKGEMGFSRVQVAWTNVEFSETEKIEDAWSLLISRDGKLVKYIRNKIVSDKEGHVKGSESLQATEPEAEAKWKASREFWINRLNKPEKLSEDKVEKKKFDDHMTKLQEQDKQRKAAAAAAAGK
jgi:hypothetical protein